MAGTHVEGAVPDVPDVPENVLDTPAAAQAVVRGGAWRILSFGLTTVLGLVSASVVVRYLGVDDFARYTAVVSLVALVAGLFEAGLATVGVREVAMLDGPGRDRFLRELLGLRVVIALLGVAVGVAIGALLGYSAPMLAGAVFGGLGVMVYTVQSNYAIVLQTELKLGFFSALEVVRQIGVTGFAVLFVVLDLGLTALIAVPLPAHALVLLATVAILRRRIPYGLAISVRRWSELVRSSLPVAASTTMGVVYAYVTILLMSAISTATETGYFSVSFRIFVIVAAVPSLLVYSVLPILSRSARDDQERLRLGIQRTLEVSATVGAGLALLTAVGAPVAVDVIAGQGDSVQSDFSPAIDVLEIHGAALLATSIVAVGAVALLSVGDYRALMLGVLLGLVTTTVLTVVLTDPFGARGAATAYLIGEVVLAVAYVLALSRRHAIRMRYAPTLRGILPALPALAVAILLPLPALPATLLAAAVFTAVALPLGAIPRELLEALPLTRRFSR